MDEEVSCGIQSGEAGVAVSWILDSGATAHITNNLGCLLNPVDR